MNGVENDHPEIMTTGEFKSNMRKLLGCHPESKFDSYELAIAYADKPPATKLAVSRELRNDLAQKEPSEARK